MSILEEAAAGRAIIRRWTVKSYHRAIKNGFLAEDPAFELLDGFIVRKDRAKAGEDPMSIGDRHRVAVQRLVKLASQFEHFQCTLQVQQPIALPPINEPEPDGSVIEGTDDDYLDGPPTAANVLSVIEIADSSLARDLGTKLRMYARAGIEQYIVVDLVHDVVLDHRQPKGGKYVAVTSFRARQTLEITTAKAKPVSIPVKRLLP